MPPYSNIDPNQEHVTKSPKYGMSHELVGDSKGDARSQQAHIDEGLVQ